MPGLKNLDYNSMQGIIDSLTDPMLIINRDLEIVWNNCAVIKNFGDQIGKKCYQFLKPGTPSPCSDNTYCIAKETFADDQKHSGEFATLSFLGQKNYFLVTSSPIFDENGNVDTTLLTLKDITSQKHMEQNICQLKELNEEIIKIVPLGIQLLDREFRICYWNPAMEGIFNIPAKEVQGKTVFEVFPGIPLNAKNEMQEIYEQVREGGEPFFRQSHRQPLPNGKTLYSNLNIYPLKDRNGLVTFILICLEDITEYKSIEYELEKKAQKQAEGIKEWEKKFHTLVENCADGIVISKEGIITYVNPALVNILGYQNPSELIGQSLKVIHHDYEDWGSISQKHTGKKNRSKSSPLRFEIKAKRKDDSTVDLDISVSHVYIYKELVSLATIRDITEKKEIEEREKKLHECILHTDRLAAMGKFAAGVAHEINNPLAVLSGRIQEMLIKYEKNEEIHRNLASMKKVSDRIDKIVDGLLSFAKQKVEPRYLYDINEVIEDAITMFEMQTVTKGVRLIKRYGPDLPPILITASQIQQVCVNLLINAIDATSLGDRIIISTRLDRKHKNIIIIFKDTGCGIPIEYQDKIFEPFFTTKDIDKGSGLGLSISAGIIKDHKGSIRVRSREGSGTIFIIKLPLPTEEELTRYGLNNSNCQI